MILDITLIRRDLVLERTRRCEAVGRCLPAVHLCYEDRWAAEDLVLAGLLRRVSCSLGHGYVPNVWPG